MTHSDPSVWAQLCNVFNILENVTSEKILQVLKLRKTLTCFWTLVVLEGRPKFNHWKIRLGQMKFKIQETKKKKNNAESSFSVGLQPITPAAACASEPRRRSLQWENIPVTLSLPLSLWSGPFLSLPHLCQPFNVPLSTAMPLISHHLGATRCAFSRAAKCLRPLKKRALVPVIDCTVWLSDRKTFHCCCFSFYIYLLKVCHLHLRRNEQNTLTFKYSRAQGNIRLWESDKRNLHFHTARNRE